MLLAHAGGWFSDPLSLCVLTLAGVLYLASFEPLGPVRSRAVGNWRRAAFVLGLVGLFFATNSPVAQDEDGDLVAHMVQHMMLVSVAAPLLVVGMPLVRFAPAIPRQIRSPGMKARLLLRRSAWLSFALVSAAVIIHSLTVWLWHVPGLYEAAIRSQALHTLEHAAFLGTAVFAWSVVMGFGAVTRPDLLTPAALFGLAAQGAALGALMAFSTTAWYPIYGTGDAATTNQQVAGLIMWGFGGGAPFVAGFALIAGWLSRSRRYPASSGLPASIPASGRGVLEDQQ